MNAMGKAKTIRAFRPFLSRALAIFGCFATSSLTMAHAAATAIQSGVAWIDNNGNTVNAHGGGIWFENGKYFLYGEYFSGGNNDFKAVAMYSSADLVNWTWVGKVLPVQASGELGPQRIGERPHILKCPGTGEYVMFIHSADLTYQADKECVYATSPTIDGIYTYRGPLTNSAGTKIVHSDMSAFQDGGTGYVVTESGYAFKLSPDYHGWVETTLNGSSVLNGAESPTLFKMNGTYYWLSSSKTGWRSNDNRYATASSIAGPWTDKGLLAPTGENTWNSQSTFVLPAAGSQGTTYMFCGDRWNADDNSKATYVWQPLVVKGAAISMPAFYASWYLNVKTGMWAADAMPTAIRGPNPGRQVFPERIRATLDGRRVKEGSGREAGPVYSAWVSEFMEPMLCGKR